jgi:rhamnosyltransferase
MAKKLVSIVVRGKNEAKWLKILFPKIMDQSFKNFEIIYCDNNSCDSTFIILKNYNINKFVKIKKYLPGKALNKAIKLSNSKYIIILSAHCIPETNQWLKEFVSFMNNNKDVVAAYGKQLPLPGTNSKNFLDLNIIFKNEQIIYSKDSYFNNANAIYNASFLKKKLFNPTLTNIEDLIWSKNALKNKHKIAYTAKSPVFHLHGVHQHEDNSNRATTTKKIVLDNDIIKKKWEKINFTNYKKINYFLIINAKRNRNKEKLIQKIKKIIINFRKNNIKINTFLILSNQSRFLKKIKFVNAAFMRTRNILKNDLINIYNKYIRQISKANYAIYLNSEAEWNFTKIKKLIKESVYNSLDSATFIKNSQENFFIEFPDGSLLKNTSLEDIANKPKLKILNWKSGCILNAELLRYGNLIEENANFINYEK